MNYFKDKSLKLLFDTLKEKYIKTSKLTGIIKLTPNEEEASKIGRFLGMHLKPNEINIIKIKQIETSINKSKFEGTNLLHILSYLYGPIITKEETKNKEEKLKENLLEELKNNYQNTKIASWLEKNLKEKNFYSKVLTLLKHDKSAIYNILNALLNLPYKENKYMNISIFSSEITKDPHYFDLESTHSHDFMYFLEIYLNTKIENTRQSKIEALNMVGIYTDNISNFVITYNLHGSIYLDNLASRGEVAILSLNNINKLDVVFSLNKQVIILENPSLLDSMMTKKLDYAFIITSGNPNIACYTLLNKLKDHKLYYHGDFDPEGLLIADKLAKKYSNLILIGYTKELYEIARSNKKISLSRIKKLDLITNKELEAIKSELIKTGNPGYQEKIIHELLELIKNKMILVTQNFVIKGKRKFKGH